MKECIYSTGVARIKRYQLIKYSLIITTDYDILGSKVDVKLVAKLSHTSIELQECHQTLFSLHFVEKHFKM